MESNFIPWVEGSAPPSPHHVKGTLREEGREDQPVWVLPESLNSGPLRHSDLDELLPVIRWQWKHLRRYFPQYRSFEDWKTGFLRDTDPEREIALWTRATYALLEFAHRHPSADRRQVFEVIRDLIFGIEVETKPKSVARTLKKLLTHPPAGFADLTKFSSDGVFMTDDRHLR